MELFKKNNSLFIKNGADKLWISEKKYDKVGNICLICRIKDSLTGRQESRILKIFIVYKQFTWYKGIRKEISNLIK